MGQKRYVIQHFDYESETRDWVIYDNVERRHVYSLKTVDIYDDSAPPYCIKICEALNYMEENKCKSMIIKV